MSDSGNIGNKLKSKWEQLTSKPFCSMAKPYFDFIGSEKIFGLVYIVMALVNLLIPFVVIFLAVKARLFDMGGKFVITFILAWVVIIFACWIGFQLWLNRQKTTASVADSEFKATPVFSKIVETFGEWMGTMIGIIGAGAGLIAAIILGEQGDRLFDAMGMGFMQFGALAILIGPAVGYFIIIVSRFLAEQLRLFAALANNTKEIAKNISK